MITHVLNRPAFVLLFTIAFLGVTQAQYSETIRTGRPGQSITAFTTGKGMLQFQQGIIYDNNTTKLPLSPESSGRADYIINSYITENVIRFGIMERLEINAAINYSWIDQKIEPPLQILDFEGDYLSALDIGGRMHFSDQNGAWPNVALQARLGMGQYTQGGDFTVMDVKITGAFSWSLWENHGLTINLIPIFNINGNAPTRNDYTLAYSWSFADKWAVFIENYGTVYFNAMHTDYFNTYVDGGFSYLVNNNVQLDVLGGYGSNQIYDGVREESFFVSAGVSWRILTAK